MEQYDLDDPSFNGDYSLDYALKLLDYIDSTEANRTLIRYIYSYYDNWIYDNNKSDFPADKMFAFEQLLNRCREKGQSVFDSFNRCFSGLVHDYYNQGLMRKYSDEETKEVLLSSSILALSLVINPTNKIKVSPADIYARLCTVHTEKTPSMFLYEQSNSYFCQGCHASGNIFNYFAKTKHISYNRSLEILADTYGISLSPRFGSTIGDKELSKDILSVQNSNFYKELKNRSEAKTERYDAWVNTFGGLICTLHDGNVDLFCKRRISNREWISVYDAYDIYESYQTGYIAIKRLHQGILDCNVWEEPGVTISLNGESYTANTKINSILCFNGIRQVARKQGICFEPYIGGLATDEEIAVILDFARNNQFRKSPKVLVKDLYSSYYILKKCK